MINSFQRQLSGVCSQVAQREEM